MLVAFRDILQFLRISVLYLYSLRCKLRETFLRFYYKKTKENLIKANTSVDPFADMQILINAMLSPGHGGAAISSVK